MYSTHTLSEKANSDSKANTEVKANSEVGKEDLAEATVGAVRTAKAAKYAKQRKELKDKVLQEVLSSALADVSLLFIVLYLMLQDFVY